MHVIDYLHLNEYEYVFTQMRCLKVAEVVIFTEVVCFSEVTLKSVFETLLICYYIKI